MAFILNKIWVVVQCFDWKRHLRDPTADSEIVDIWAAYTDETEAEIEAHSLMKMENKESNYYFRVFPVEMRSQ